MLFKYLLCVLKKSSKFLPYLTSEEREISTKIFLKSFDFKSIFEIVKEYKKLDLKALNVEIR